MEDFPPICKQDPLDVQLYFIHDHLKKTRETIQLEDIPKEMFGGVLLVAKGRKSKKRALTEAEHLDDASETPSKKVKKVKIATQAGTPSIQEEVQDLKPVKVLNKRTRSVKEAEPSPSQPAQPSIPRRKRKHVVKKLKNAPEEEEIEEATKIVLREVRRRKEVDAADLEKALQLAKEIEVPAEVLAKESTVQATQLGIELTENLQQMAEVDDLVKANEGGQEEASCSEAVASEALKGNTDSLHTAEIVNIESSTSSNSRSTPASLSTSSSTTSDMDDIPLNKVCENLNKRLSPSSSTKTHKKPDSDTFVPMYPSVVERIHDMQQRRINACGRLHVDHPLQPPMIEPIPFVPADAEGVTDQTGPKSANIDVSLSPTQTSETLEPFVI